MSQLIIKNKQQQTILQLPVSTCSTPEFLSFHLSGDFHFKQQHKRVVAVVKVLNSVCVVLPSYLLFFASFSLSEEEEAELLALAAFLLERKQS